MIWIRMAVVWSVMRRYGAGCVLACVVLAGGVVVMVFVPFRGGWLVLLGKGTLVHNHPDTKGKHPIFEPSGRPTSAQTFALTLFKAATNAALYQTARLTKKKRQFDRPQGVNTQPRSIKLPTPAKFVYRQARKHPFSDRSVYKLHNPLPHLHKRLPNMCAIQPRTVPRVGLRHPTQKPLYLCPERLTSGIKQFLSLIGDHGEDAPAVVGTGVPQGQSFCLQPPQMPGHRALIESDFRSEVVDSQFARRGFRQVHQRPVFSQAHAVVRGEPFTQAGVDKRGEYRHLSPFLLHHRLLVRGLAGHLMVGVVE